MMRPGLPIEPLSQPVASDTPFQYSVPKGVKAAVSAGPLRSGQNFGVAPLLMALALAPISDISE
jgi:hypothetical protein